MIANQVRNTTETKDSENNRYQHSTETKAGNEAYSENGVKTFNQETESEVDGGLRQVPFYLKNGGSQVASDEDIEGF